MSVRQTCTRNSIVRLTRIRKDNQTPLEAACGQTRLLQMSASRIFQCKLAVWMEPCPVLAMGVCHLRDTLTASHTLPVLTILVYLSDLIRSAPERLQSPHQATLPCRYMVTVSLHSNSDNSACTESIARALLTDLPVVLMPSTNKHQPGLGHRRPHSQARTAPLLALIQRITCNS